MKFSKQIIYRPTWAEIDLTAFEHNLRALKKNTTGNTEILAVLKANGYGHGAVPLAKRVIKNSVKFIGVSSIEEGLELRRSGIKKASILVLGTLFPRGNFSVAFRNNITVTIASLTAAKVAEIAAKKLRKAVPVHVKIDTGMGRIGVSSANSLPLIKYLSKSKNLVLEGMYTHFASADCDSDFTNKQISAFKETAAAAERIGINIPILHTANSAAMLKHPESHFDMVRPGLALYGISPFKENNYGLKPVMSWKTQVVFLKEISPGTSLSYGRTFVALRKSRIATLPVGYADGYQRILSNKGKVLIRGKRCPIVGRVTMDQILVDVTDLPEVKVGDEAVLMGLQGKESIPACEIAGWCNTIPYEIVCGVSSRVPRVYL